MPVKIEAHPKENVQKKWDGDFPEEMTFAQSEGRVNTCQTWKIMEEERSIINSETCSDPMGRGERGRK